MAKARSPAYPSISLREAVERVTAVYQEDYQNPIPKAVVAQHMGYVGLNGKSLGVLSSLSKFGLLEGRGDESRVTDLAVRIIAHPPASPERAQALKQAAAEPGLFAELDARFQGGKASDQAIRSYLLTQRFIPTAAETAIRSYRETKQFVDAEAAGLDDGIEYIDDSQRPSASFPPPNLDRQSPHRDGMGSSAAGQGGQAPPRETYPSSSILSLDALSEDEPYRIQLRSGGIDVVATLEDGESIEKLVQALKAVKVLIPPKKATRQDPLSNGIAKRGDGDNT